LVGSSAYDYVGAGLYGYAGDGYSGVVALSNGNYVLASPNWDNGAASDAGAVTWCSGTAGIVGVVSSANSLVGSSANDFVGRDVTALSNSNYVIGSPNWSNGAVTNAGAVTWCSGTAGIVGVVSSANSLVGSSVNDQVGYSGVWPLSNGNYVL